MRLQGLYSGGSCCAADQVATGGWSYGTQVSLGSVASNATRAAMMADASKMFAIRNAHPKALHRDRCTTRIASLGNFSSTGNSTALWVPYARWAANATPAEQELVIVVANNDNASAVTIRPALGPALLAEVFGSSASTFEVSDAWAGSEAKSMSAAEVAALEVQVGADLTAHGGIGVIVLRLGASLPEGPSTTATEPPGMQPRRMPKFSWDTLAVGWHSSNASGLWGEDDVKTLSRYSIVTLEKMQGVDFVVPASTLAHKALYFCQDIENEADLSACMMPGKQVEDQHILAAKAIKAHNPDVVVLSYLNSVIQYPWYGAARTLAAHPEWWLRNSSGAVMHNLASGRPANESWLTYDHSVPGANDAWMDACLNLTSSGDVDACYVDGCTKVPSGLEPAKEKAYGPAKMSMLVQLQAKVAGPLICGSNGAVWPGLAGSQIQNWGKSGKYSTREIPMLQRAVSAGVLFEAHGGQVCKHKGDPHAPEVQTELAAFLVAAGEQSYYMCSGWSGTKPVWYPVYDMPIGPPLANATLEAGVWRRQFQHVNVTYDTKTETGVIGWPKTKTQDA